MRLKLLNVSSFGKLPPGLELEFEPGLNLIMAPNEAGKTTTLELITALLYGFGKRKGGVHPYEPWTGESYEVGAELAYELADGREFNLSRHLLKRGERLSLQDAAGSQLDLAGREPGEVHLGLSKGVFHTVSRVQLDDLRAAFSGANPKEYQDTRQELTGLFFVEAATRGEVRNPIEVREAWVNEAAALFHTHGNRGRADKELNDQLANAETGLAQAREREEQAKQVQSDLEALTAQEISLANDYEAATRELEQIQNATTQVKELARKADLQAEISALTAQSLVDESFEQRARDLQREATAARERGRQAQIQSADQTAKAGQSDPAQEQARLTELESRLTILETKEKEAVKQGEELGRLWVSLESDWSMDLESLAGLKQDLPFQLHELNRDMCQAQYESGQALRQKQTLPPPPQWALPLGLGTVAFLVSLKWLLWSYFASWPWWSWAGAGMLFAAGIVLGVGALVKKGRAQAQVVELERLDLEAKAAADRAADLEAKLKQASIGLNPKALSAAPAVLAAAMLESKNLLEQSQRQAASLSKLAAEREEAMRELAGFVGAAASEKWRQALKQAQQVCQAKLKARSEAERLVQQAEQEKARAQALSADLSQLLADAGLADMEALEEARNRFRKMEQLKAKLGEVEERLQKGTLSGPVFNDLAACQAALEEVQQRAQALQSELSEISQRRGRLEQELNQLNRSQSAAQAEAACQELRRRRWDLARRHGVLLLAGACLEKAMQRFRLEAQPSLLKKASNLLSKTSAGAYEWLGSNMFDQKPGQDPDLTAKPGPGSMERHSQALSRGTQDQLYFSLRLALAQEITEDQEPVPLLLDDPLVNFDDDRLAASLEMLAGLASERQVVLFTCHRVQYELLRQMADCNFLELKCD